MVAACRLERPGSWPFACGFLLAGFCLQAFAWSFRLRAFALKGHGFSRAVNSAQGQKRGGTESHANSGNRRSRHRRRQRHGLAVTFTSGLLQRALRAIDEFGHDIDWIELLPGHGFGDSGVE